jgi:hypothetical protein
MKVYALLYQDYDDAHLLGVFADRDRAEACIEEARLIRARFIETCPQQYILGDEGGIILNPATREWEKKYREALNEAWLFELPIESKPDWIDILERDLIK